MKQFLAPAVLGTALLLPGLATAQVSPTPNQQPTQTQAEQATDQPRPAAPTPNFFLKDGKLPLNADASRYFKITLLNQVWMRYNESNPGTTVGGYAVPNTYDLGIRRFRIQLYGQLTDRVFIYSQIGINNLAFNSDRKADGTPASAETATGGFFLHDAVVEYAIVKNKLSFGTGLGAWNGLARYASSSAGTIMGLDLPGVEETTNDVNDQFGRKLSAYLKGKLGKLDYRVALTNPLIYQKAAGYVPTPGPNANFASTPPKPQYQGYFSYQFKDQESNLTPYAAGSYLGKKSVFNVGAGFIVQPDAMWYTLGGVASNVQTKAMQQYAVDVFYDAPLSAAPDAPSVSFYAAALHLDYGPGYLRNNAPMNPGTGTTNTNTTFGFGNAFPQYGTGNVIYSQLGYKLKDNLVGTTTFMPYVSYQHARYGRLTDDVNYYDAGLNWLVSGHTSKFTLAYQNRPYYATNSTGENVVSSRRSAVILQYQVYFN
ncbi:hypothetical protein E4631_07230 [Hymenobacter sp. UV11]|uniref:hypothetical protein n=1 Tax=Hymenobacter sp. UV11 TaxID=1849735 RepID=UPI00105E916D|nr:hypothetical protein [Hymenobacter sp. UV11]TDN37126.1 hypothetical protein A8B98_05205 [Hymenobacter sp. UV11]TFZ67754.1 hypothetical protein E4631_07230 [Hymenobacter sp. UV11]